MIALLVRCPYLAVQFSRRLFWGRAGIAVLHTVIIFLFVTWNSAPDNESVWTMGSLLYTAVMLTITAALCMDISYVN